MKVRMWVTAIAGGAALLCVMAVFSLMVAAPDRNLARLDRRSDAARDALVKVWVDDARGRDPTTLDTSRLDRVVDGYEIRARVTGTSLVLTARGNLDGDDGIDDWQLTSRDPKPLHLYDDARDLWIDASIVEVYGVSAAAGATPDFSPGDRLRIPSLIAAFRKSRQARVVIEDLSRDESKHFSTKGTWVAFETLTPGVWRELADTTSGSMAYSIRARAEGTSVILTAVGNVDDDPCLDVWATKPGDLVPEHLQDDVVLDECPVSAP